MLLEIRTGPLGRESARPPSSRWGRRIATCALFAVAACHSPDAASAPPARTASRAPAESPRSSPTSSLRSPWNGGRLTVREAVELALERNPDVRSARARVETARAGFEASEAALWPRLSADLSVLHSDAPSTYLFKSIDAHSLAPGTDFNSPGSIDNTEAGLGLSWNLWNGGRDRLAREAAQAGVAMESEGVLATRNTLVLAVVAACLDARAARELLVSDEASLRSIESQLSEVRARVEQGAALRSDQLSLEVRLAEARERRLHTELAQRLALATLRNLLVLEGDVTIDLAAEPFDPGSLPSSLTAARELAFEQRPELRSAKHAVDRADLGIESARRSWLPRLDLEGRLYADVNDYSLDLNDPNATVALILSYALFEGGSRRAELARAKASREEYTEAELRARSAIALEVEMAWLRREEARERVDVAAQAVGASQETLTLVEKQFRSGVATVTRFLEAEAARSQVESSLIRARLDLERSDVELARAVGGLAGGG